MNASLRADFRVDQAPAELVKRDILHVSLTELAALADPERNIAARPEALAIESRYATRRLPIEGLFIDHDSRDKRMSAAQKWAEKLLREMLDLTASTSSEDRQSRMPLGPSRDPYTGMELAERLWEAYDDHDNKEELFRKRVELSELLARAASGAYPNS